MPISPAIFTSLVTLGMFLWGVFVIFNQFGNL